jgi:DNA-directed RNA polymerase subunit RPC12/RpoP
MVKRKYVCKKCGRTFVVQVFEKGEAEEKKLRGSPVRCLHCGSQDVVPT